MSPQFDNQNQKIGIDILACINYGFHTIFASCPTVAKTFLEKNSSPGSSVDYRIKHCI